MEVRKSALVDHTPENMFDLIEAAEHYPAFLPWCAAATILSRDESMVVATIAVAYHGVRFSFTTRNPKRRPEWLAVTLDEGPFRRFEGEWRLTPLGATGCKVAFVLRYDFDGAVARTMAGPVFERIADTFVDAFVMRAERVYAGSQPDRGPTTTSTTGLSNP